MTHTTEVYSALGAAHYLSGYMKKGMYNHAALEEAGFKRRWSASRKWPRSDLRLAETEWRHIDWIDTKLGNLVHAAEGVEATKNSPLQERSGTEMAEAMEGVWAIRRKKGRVKRMERRIKDAVIS